MGEHTPTPWQISPVRTTEDTAMIVGGEGFEFGLIADVTEDFDAAFIVKAVNNHDALVKALENIAIYGCGMLSQPPAMNGPEEAWLRMRIAAYERCARDALASTPDLHGEGG